MNLNLLVEKVNNDKTNYGRCKLLKDEYGGMKNAKIIAEKTNSSIWFLAKSVKDIDPKNPEEEKGVVFI